jgi:hypothetical protein
MLNVIMLIVIMLNVVMLNVFMLNVIMLIVVAPCLQSVEKRVKRKYSVIDAPQSGLKGSSQTLNKLLRCATTPRCATAPAWQKALGESQE